MKELEENSFDMIFADPPYFLSNDGIVCKSGKMASVNKGEWDRSKGFDENLSFIERWLSGCYRVLKDSGTIWISGTLHIIYEIGFLLEKLGFKILNDIVWFKPNASPNLACKYFVHSHETLLWAKKANDVHEYYNYNLMKHWDDPNDKIKNRGKQMRDVWWMPTISPKEKKYGEHPTQKPLNLLIRIIASCTKKHGNILDPFNGAGTTGIAARLLSRKYTGIELNKDYLDLTERRLAHKNELEFYYPKMINSPTLF